MTRQTVDETREARATQAVGAAIQDLAAARVGRALLPVAGLLLLATLRWAFGGGQPGLRVALAGAPPAVAAMLAYAVRLTRRGFGAADEWWMPLAAVAGFVPTLYGFFCLGWMGVRPLMQRDAGWATPVAFIVLGWWCVRAWMKVVELERLSRVMRTAVPGEGGT